MGGELCDAAVLVDSAELDVLNDMMDVEARTPQWHFVEYSETTQLVLSTVIDKNYASWRINVCIKLPSYITWSVYNRLVDLDIYLDINSQSWQ